MIKDKQKTAPVAEQTHTAFINTEKLQKASAGANFLGFISKINEQSEIFLTGNAYSALLPSEESSFDLSIDTRLISTLIQNENITKMLNIHLDPSLEKSEKISAEKPDNYIPYLNSYDPIQISSNKNSCAILLKTRDDFKNSGKFNDYKVIFNEINTNLKNKKETFQTYFLSNHQNDTIRNFEDKWLMAEIGNKTNENIEQMSSYGYIYFVDFEERLSELIGKNFKNYDSLLKSMKEVGIISSNKINMLKFYQILKGYDSICTTKVIILGEFAKQWFKNYDGEFKNKWQDIYNKTLSFELPTVLLPLKQVEIGNNHILLLTVEGEVYAMGDGSKGATGNMNRKFHCQPLKVEFPYPNTVIDKIAAGSRHSLALDNGNTLYSWGCGACGCLGLNNTNDSFDPKPITFANSCDTIIQIDAADNYSAFVTSEGSLYTFGNSQFNRLGLADGLNSLIPQKVKEPFINCVSNIKCGYLTTLVQTSKGAAFGLGIQSLSEIVCENKDAKIPNVELVNGKTYDIKIPLRTNNDGLKDRKVLSMFIGNRFYGLITSDIYKQNSDKKVRFWKGGDFKQKATLDLSLRELYEDEGPFVNLKLGFDTTVMVETTKEKKLSMKKEIKKIVCSQNNTAITTTTGDVYVFGSYLYQVAPTQLENCYLSVQPRGAKVVHVALGANHILMITTSKEVYAAGRNMEGQLGLGFTSNKIDISVAKSIELFTHQGAKKCYAAENYSVVITTGTKSKLWIFGDIPFLQSSFYSNKQLSPKEMNWGEVDKLACGSTHLLLLVKDVDNFYSIQSVGNGMYGKLGDGDSTGKNHSEPIRVDLPYQEIKYTQDVKMRCGKYTSGVLIKEEQSKENDQSNKLYNLYMWGLCHHELFSNLREVERKHSFGETFPIDSTLPVLKPTLITAYNIQNFAIGEGICYFITSGQNELKTIGKFYGRRLKSKGMIVGQFNKVALGLTHGAAISKNGKMFTWGSNVMNKLGFPKQEVAGIEGLNDTDLDKLFIETPNNVVKFNQIFEEQDTVQKDEEINKLLNMNDERTPEEESQDEKEEIPPISQESNTVNVSITPRPQPTTPTNDVNAKIPPTKKDEDPTPEEEQPEDEVIVSDTVYSKARTVIKFSNPKFHDLENKLMQNENTLQSKLKDILQNYKMLVDKTSQAKLKYKALQNMFFFKFADKPLNINFKDSQQNWSKFPPRFLKFKRNYKALLSTLHTHPCYLLRIYENELFDDQELYKIIKAIFKGMRKDRFTQLIVITLCTQILAIDIKKQNITTLDQYKVIESLANDKEKLTLFGRLCRLLFKMDCELIKRQEVAAAFIISNIFSTVEKPNDCEEDLLIVLHPDNIGKKPKPQFNNYQRNSRIDKIINQFEYFANDLVKKSSLEKNILFSVNSNTMFKPLFKLPEICLLLIQEIVNVLKKVTPDVEKIYDWLGKKFSIIFFSHLLKVIENPSKQLTIDASLLIDRALYRQFMESCKDNFYSVAYSFRFCFHYLSIHDSSLLPEDEINKQIEKVFKNKIYSSMIINLKEIMMNKQDFEVEISPQKPMRFDLEFLKEFFQHSLSDSNYVINFSLYHLKRLLEVIIPHRAKIRVLDENYDVMEQILAYNNLLQDGGLMKEDIGIDNNLYCQFKLKTKTLSIKTPAMLMKCHYCHTILLNDYIIGNEDMFFEQFLFINKSSVKGKYISILKELDPVEVKNDKFNLYLKQQFEKKKEQFNFKENLYQLFTLMAVDAKEDLLISEEIISDPVQLFQIMFSQNSPNTIMKKYSEEIILTYEKMKEQIKYHQTVFDTLDEIQKETNIEEIQNINNIHFLIDVYTKVGGAILRGYGNDELSNMTNSLVFSSKFVRLIKHNDDLPRSDVIVEKLPQSLKKNIQPMREYDLSKLIEKRSIIKVVINSEELVVYPLMFRLSFLKNENFEFIITISKGRGEKSSVWSCSSKKEEASNFKKIHTITLKNNTLAKIIKYATLKTNNIPPVMVEQCLEVNPRLFLKLLKKICDIGFY